MWAWRSKNNIKPTFIGIQDPQLPPAGPKLGRGAAGQVEDRVLGELDPARQGRGDPREQLVAHPRLQHQVRRMGGQVLQVLPPGEHSLPPVQARLQAGERRQPGQFRGWPALQQAVLRYRIRVPRDMRGQLLVRLRGLLLDLAVEDPVEVPEQGQAAATGGGPVRQGVSGRSLPDMP